MVHLNKHQLTRPQLESLFAQLNVTLEQLPALDTNKFLAELLGYEERVMLAKRLAVIILLAEGKSLYKISEILKLSPSTAKQLKTKLDNGQFTSIMKVLGKNKKNYFALLEALDDILHLGGILPHYNGLDRYRF